MGLSGQLTALRLEVPQPDASPLRILDLPHLDFEAGSVVGISGPSGSGKTSLLHCLAGLMRPTSGAILWNDQDIATLSAPYCDLWRREHVGLVFQDFQLIPELSVIENMALPQYFSDWRLSEAQRDSMPERKSVTIWNCSGLIRAKPCCSLPIVWKRPSACPTA